MRISPAGAGPQPHRLLAGVSRACGIALERAGACRSGLSAREGDLEALTDTITHPGPPRAVVAVVIDQAVDLARALLAHQEQTGEILRCLHVAASLLEEWAAASARSPHRGKDPTGELEDSLGAARSTAASAASALLAATHCLAPTAQDLSSDPSLLAGARSSSSMCRRFTLTGHGALTQLVDELEHLRYLCLAQGIGHRAGLQLGRPPPPRRRRGVGDLPENVPGNRAPVQAPTERRTHRVRDRRRRVGRPGRVHGRRPAVPDPGGSRG